MEKKYITALHKGTCLVNCVTESELLLRNLRGVCSHGVSCETVRYVMVTRVVWGNEKDVDRRSLSCGKISVGSNTSVTGKQSKNLLWRIICGVKCLCDR